MNQNHITIRLEKQEDYRETENLVRESFWNVYRPGCVEHYVLSCLRDDPDFVPELDYVMESDGVLIGQTVFVKAVIKSDDGRNIPVMTMGPICITPALKRQGYGKQLLDYTLDKAKEYGCKAVCFEGNIDFYGKSGFDYASRFGIRYHGLPEGADASFFLLKELEDGYLDGITGEYAPPRGNIPAKDLALAEKIKECQENCGKTYGYRRVHIWLERQGVHHNPKTILRVMQKYNLLSVIRRKRYRNYGEHLHRYPNLLNRDFKAEKPNQKWVTDISYIKTGQGTLYLSVIKICLTTVLSLTKPE